MQTLGVLLIGLALLTPQLSDALQHQQSPTLAFLHATIIDGTDTPIQPDMTVVVSGNRITEIDETDNVRVPHGAKRIDATGKFIIPGLWDMHVHWYLKDYLPLFIANGVLGIRLMWGAPEHQVWRKEIEQGTLLGPRLVIAGRIVDGLNPIWRGSVAVGDAAQAREGVRQEQQEGADFIKIYNLLTRDAFFAIVDEANRQGLRFAGHVPYSISAVEASAAGQHSIEHLTGILLATSTREEELREMTVDVWTSRPEGQRWPSRATTHLHRRQMLETFSPQKATALFAHFKRNDTWQTPTMGAHNVYFLIPSISVSHFMFHLSIFK